MRDKVASWNTRAGGSQKSKRYVISKEGDCRVNETWMSSTRRSHKGYGALNQASSGSMEMQASREN